MRFVVLLILLVVASPAIGVTLTSGDLLIVDQGKSGTPGRVLYLESNSLTQSIVSSGGELVGNGRGIAVDAAGRIFVVNSSTDSLIMIDPSDGSQELITSGGLLSSPLDLSIDTDGTLLIINSAPSAGLVRVDPSDGSQHAISSDGFMVNPFGLTLGPSGTALIAESTGQGDGGKIIEINLNTGVQQVIASGQFLSRPYDLVMDSASSALVADNGGGSIIRIDLETGTQQILSTGFMNIWGLALGTDSAVLALDPNFLGSEGALVRVDAITGGQSIVASGGYFSNPLRLAVVPEPSTALLVGMGLALIGAAHARKPS